VFNSSVYSDDAESLTAHRYLVVQNNIVPCKAHVDKYSLSDSYHARLQKLLINWHCKRRIPILLFMLFILFLNSYIPILFHYCEWRCSHEIVNESIILRGVFHYNDGV
jgi:hypothetical protein